MKCPFCKEMLTIKDIGYADSVPREADVSLDKEGKLKYYEFTEYYDAAYDAHVICRKCYARLLEKDDMTDEKLAELIDKIQKEEEQE